MKADNIFDDNIELLNDQEKLKKKIHSYKKISQESMTLIDNNNPQAAISNYNQLLGQIKLEAQDYSQLDLSDCSPLSTEYIEAIRLLEDNLIESVTEESVYSCHNNIYKAFNKI